MKLWKYLGILNKPKCTVIHNHSDWEIFGSTIIFSFIVQPEPHTTRAVVGIQSPTTMANLILTSFRKTPTESQLPNCLLIPPPSFQYHKNDGLLSLQRNFCWYTGWKVDEDETAWPIHEKLEKCPCCEMVPVFLTPLPDQFSLPHSYA